MIKCRCCADRGLPKGCPECGKILGIHKQSASVPINEMEKIKIPEEYQNVIWDTDELKNSHPMLLSDNNFINYCNQLDKLSNLFTKGEIPKTSGIIISKRGYGKKTLAYYCMRVALSYGYTVCPMLDNTQIKRINQLSADNPTSWVLRQLPSVDEITYCDVLFVTVDIDNYSTALRTIESIMDKRARQSKSTFIISRYSLDEMSMFQQKRSYLTLLDSTGKLNNRKYPVVINYKGEY